MFVRIALLAALAAGLMGCGQKAPIPALRDDGAEVKIDRSAVRNITAVRFPEGATDEDLVPLERSIEAMREICARGYAAADEDRFLQLDMQFHLALARATGNPTVASLMRALLRQLEIARDMAMHLPLVPEWTLAIHERTLDAVRSGDLELVSEVMDEHLGQLERTAESDGKVA